MTPGPGIPGPGDGAPPPRRPRQPSTVEERLFSLEDGPAFNFYRAVRLLEQMDRARKPVGRIGPPRAEAVRFRMHPSLSFAASDIYEVQRSTSGQPVMAVTFLGLFGHHGVLPDHYTELILEKERFARGEDRYAFRDWLDLFNHRLISLFYRAWEKYRFYVPYERGEYADRKVDPFTLSLLSLVGLAPEPVRGRLRVFSPVQEAGEVRERVLARVDDLALLHYSGFLSRRVRCAVSLEGMLRDYFGLPVAVEQFRGQWLRLGQGDQTALGTANGEVGMTAMAGDRIWDVQSKIRLRVGPLRYAEFDSLLPDRTPVPGRKAFFLLCHLTRLYVGAELDYDVQLILRAPDVPACQLSAKPPGPRLGWNTWVLSGPAGADADDAVFEADEATAL